MVKVYVERECEAYVTEKLASVLSKVNMIYNCVPDYMHFYMENVRSNVVDSLKGLECTINISNKGLESLDMVSLYTNLNEIYNDLNECSLLTFGHVDITFAYHNVGFIIEKMVECDDLFKWCYDNNVKRRVLK